MPTIKGSTHTITNMEKNYLSRKYSFTDGCKISLENKVIGIKNSSLDLKRTKAISNLALSFNDGGKCNLVKIEYNNIKAEEINSRNYLYCGAITTLPINSIGISIDEDGHLALIKGESHDFFKGVFIKYTTGYKYKTSPLVNEGCDKKFESLYIDDNGLLIGTEKYTGKNYIIKISPAELDINDDGQLVTLEYLEYFQKDKNEGLTFEIDKGNYISFFTKYNKLYLKSIHKGNDVKDYSFLFLELKIPLRPHYRLASIKKTMNVLQLEVRKGNKRRVLYIDPKYISHHNLLVKKISHKPPQCFPSRVGNDPHEKYHAGLPFTSDRKANFSSKYIPLFSSMVDNFRIHIKKAKLSSVECKHKESIIHIAKAIDPGVGGACVTVYDIIKSKRIQTKNNSSRKQKLYHKNINILRLRSKSLSRVANDALGVEPKQKISESLINLSNEIKARDVLHLCSANKITAFFGIASGGLPFAPGWFAGIILELSNSHNLTIGKTKTGNIIVSFKNRKKEAAIFVAGTGQGLERTLQQLGGVDYMTVMPAEANAIIATQRILGDNFSFDLSEEHFREFAMQFGTIENDDSLRGMVITEAEAEKLKENEFSIRLEAKSELRLQAGSMVNPSTYMVMPRTALGARLALDLLKIKKEKHESSAKKENAFHSKKDNFIITALDHEAALFAEWKVMPITMRGGGEDITLCYPLPLLEEAKTINQYTRKKTSTILERRIENQETTTSCHNFSTLKGIKLVRRTPFFVTINNESVVKGGLMIKKAASVDKYIGAVDEILSELKRDLSNKQRDSQNKSSIINVVSHYEPIFSPSISFTKVTGNSLSKSNTSAAKSYRLIKLEFRRLGSLQHREVTIPMPILSLSTTNNITYDQYLGEVEFQYASESAVTPMNVKRKLLTFY